MYNVIKDISRCEKLFIVGGWRFSDAKEFKLTDGVFRYGGLDAVPVNIKFGVRMDDYEGAYDNGILTIPEVGDIVILQDYGDFELSTPEGMLEIPRELVLPPDEDHVCDLSIGIYDDQCCLIGKYFEELYIVKLDGDFVEEIDWGNLWMKRPFAMSFHIGKEKFLESDVIIQIRLAMGEKSRMFDFVLPFKYKDIIHPDNVFRVGAGNLPNSIKEYSHVD